MTTNPGAGTSGDTLTDRYLAAVARSIPAAERGDATAELRASIEDQIDARRESGESEADAERAVLTGLGDPLALAASLSGRPLHLIGPRYYAAWWRLLRLLLITVVPSAALIAGLARAIGGGGIGDVIGAMIPAIIISTVNVGFWTTLVFAALERTGSTGETVLDWSPDKLPHRIIPIARIADLIATIVVFAILIGAVVWDRTVGWGQDQVHLLAPGLWPVTMIVWFALLALVIVVEVLVVVRGRWTLPLALISTALSAVALIGAIWLIWQNRVLDPGLMARMAEASTPTTDVLQIVNIVLTVVVGGILIGTAFDVFRKLGLVKGA